MSFIINWDLIRFGSESEKLKDYLNEKFSEVVTPDFLGSIHVSELDFGTSPNLPLEAKANTHILIGDIPPEIAIENICDPWPIFYETPEARSDYLGTLQSQGNYDASTIDSHSMGRNSSYPPPLPLVEGEAEELAQAREMHTQVEVSVAYHGNMRIRIQTELIVNQPTKRLGGIHVVHRIVHVATALTAFLGDVIFFCLKQPPPGQTILPNLLFESEVGDTDRSVLKNVGKIEKFIAEQIRKFFDDYLVYPNYHSILIEPDVDNTSDLVSNLS